MRTLHLFALVPLLMISAGHAAKALRFGPFQSKFLRSAAMVVCEGEHGWDDYLLLHHWDRRFRLDSVPMSSNNAFKGRRAKRARP